MNTILHNCGREVSGRRVLALFTIPSLSAKRASFSDPSQAGMKEASRNGVHPWSRPWSRTVCPNPECNYLMGCDRNKCLTSPVYFLFKTEPYHLLDEAMSMTLFELQMRKRKR